MPIDGQPRLHGGVVKQSQMGESGPRLWDSGEEHAPPTHRPMHAEYTAHGRGVVGRLMCPAGNRDTQNGVLLACLSPHPLFEHEIGSKP